MSYICLVLMFNCLIVVWELKLKVWDFLLLVMSCCLTPPKQILKFILFLSMISFSCIYILNTISVSLDYAENVFQRVYVLNSGSRALFIGPTSTKFNKIFIKTGSHDTIHTFKNYFVSVFSVFSNKRYPKRPFVMRWFKILNQFLL